MSDFKSTGNKGFQLTFDNGLTISVQFGTHNYCSRRSLSLETPDNEMTMRIIESGTAEIAIWDKQSDEWFDFGHDQVKGWCTPDEVVDWMVQVKNAVSLSDIKNPEI